MELLIPAKDFNTAKVALYSGADAIYCGVKKYSARAYAVNLTIDEVKELSILAHTLKKKVYVTVNTIIKEDELDDAFSLLNDLYLAEIDGVIVTDYALIKYMLDNLPGLEVHISTQSGVKFLSDALFFERLGAKRTVIARENTIKEIKYIKENSNIELEVFIHGALCVSYSGGCLMSSFLSLRSGNRGRCSQNCRREYQLYEDDKMLNNYSFELSMKDLDIARNIKDLIDLNIASAKIEGRMKDEYYVNSLTSFYRNLIDNKKADFNVLDKIFHRPYTKGFLFNEDPKNIVDNTKRTNEGELIGSIIKKDGKLTRVLLNKELKIKDRIRIDADEAYYFNIDKIYDKSKKEVLKNIGTSYLTIFKNFPEGTKIYRMKDESKELNLDDSYKYRLIIDASGSLGEPLLLKTNYFGEAFYASTSISLDKANKNPLTKEQLFNQLSRLNDTSFVLKDINFNVEDDLFIPVSEINKAKRELIDNILHMVKLDRKLRPVKEIKPINYDIEDKTLTVYCFNEEQYKAAKELGVKYIYYKNYIPYIGKQTPYDEDYVLISNYGGILEKNKELISDYTFNVINSKAIYELHKEGIKYVTLSLETSFNELKKIVKGYTKYGNNPNIEYVVYGKYQLMKLKYCPLKKYGLCGKCNDKTYYLKDKFDKFPILHKDCNTFILNSRPLNLIDEVDDIIPYAKRLRINFTNEGYSEAYAIIKLYQDKLQGKITDKRFNEKTDTKGYFKREIE